MTDSRTLGQRVPKEGLFLMDGIEGLPSKHCSEHCLNGYVGSCLSRLQRSGVREIW